MKTSALIIVDVQNDFLPGGALPVKEGNQVIDVINKIQEKYMLVVATKDWHPLHHQSFAVEHGKLPGEEINLLGVNQILWPVHCVQNSYGAEFPQNLKTECIDQVFYKGIEETIDSYSAFFDNAHARSTGLDAYLRQKCIEKLTIVGLATDYCVKYSVLDACKLGYKVTVLLGGCRGINLHENDVKSALEEMQRAGALIVD